MFKDVRYLNISTLREIVNAITGECTLTNKTALVSKVQTTLYDLKNTKLEPESSCSVSVKGGAADGDDENNDDGDKGGDDDGDDENDDEGDDNNDDENNDDGESGEDEDDSPATIVIYVRLPTGRSHEMSVDEGTTIWEVKLLVQERYRIPRCHQRLTWGGATCENAEEVAESNIYQVCLNIRGGGKRAAGGADKKKSKSECLEKLAGKLGNAVALFRIKQQQLFQFEHPEL